MRNNVMAKRENYGIRQITELKISSRNRYFCERKLRKSAKILHRINKSIIFAKEKCGNPQKSFLL